MSETPSMRALVFDAPGHPLREQSRPIPRPGPGELLLRVRACGVCRTDLHLLDGDLAIEHPPRVLGHQIVASVLEVGEAVGEAGSVQPSAHRRGDRVGVPWLGWTCGECRWCLSGRENLCPRARFTGRDIDGGMAEYALADVRYCFPIPADYPDEQAAPLLCAGLIGYRSLRMCGDARRIGLYGFGAAAHIVAQVAVWEGREVYAFTRAGDRAAQALARELGAAWTGPSEQAPPLPLDAAIVFAPVGALVPTALRALAPAGVVVCAGIYMSEIPAFPYELLWLERTVRSVANLTRRDALEFLALAPRVPVRTHVSVYALAEAQRALEDLRAGRFAGAAVIRP